MHDITSILPIGVNPPLGFNAKLPPHVNRRRAPRMIRLGFNSYDVICFCVSIVRSEMFLVNIKELQ